MDREIQYIGSTYNPITEFLFAIGLSVLIETN